MKYQQKLDLRTDFIGILDGEPPVIAYLKNNQDKPYLDACYDYAREKYDLLSRGEIKEVIKEFRYRRELREAHGSLPLGV